jgi:hypothetical protein
MGHQGPDNVNFRNPGPLVTTRMRVPCMERRIQRMLEPTYSIGVATPPRDGRVRGSREEVSNRIPSYS